jgi:hypothetical protein
MLHTYLSSWAGTEGPFEAKYKETIFIPSLKPQQMQLSGLLLQKGWLFNCALWLSCSTIFFIIKEQKYRETIY